MRHRGQKTWDSTKSLTQLGWTLRFPEKPWFPTVTGILSGKSYHWHLYRIGDFCCHLCFWRNYSRTVLSMTLSGANAWVSGGCTRLHSQLPFVLDHIPPPPTPTSRFPFYLFSQSCSSNAMNAGPHSWVSLPFLFLARALPCPLNVLPMHQAHCYMVELQPLISSAHLGQGWEEATRKEGAGWLKSTLFSASIWSQPLIRCYFILGREWSYLC